jgi:anti-sigma factor RsiW
MPACQELEALVTACIDGVATADERRMVDVHLGQCPSCRRRAEVEGAARTLVRTRAARVFRTEAPPVLIERCRALSTSSEAAAGTPAGWRAGVARVPLAAGVVLAIAAALYALTASSTTTLAAQLTLDHIKCFTLTGDPNAPVRAEAVETQLRERYGWTVDVPGDSEANQLKLMGGRRCLYGEGTIAHVLYRHNGAPLSLFMLPEKVRPSEIVEVMGHAAIIWSQNQRTFVLLGGEPKPEMEKIARYIRAMVK